MGIINIEERIKTNADALINQTTIAETKITRHGGVIEIFGELWLCKPLKAEIKEGKKVKVVKIEGNTLFVEEI